MRFLNRLRVVTGQVKHQIPWQRFIKQDAHLAQSLPALARVQLLPARDERKETGPERHRDYLRLRDSQKEFLRELAYPRKPAFHREFRDRDVPRALRLSSASPVTSNNTRLAREPVMCKFDRN